MQTRCTLKHTCCTQKHQIGWATTCRTRLALSLPVSECLQAKGIARGVRCSAHMLLPRGIAILSWPWGAGALLAAMRSTLYTVCCLPAGYGCHRGAVGTWARFAVHCRRPGKDHNFPMAVASSHAQHRQATADLSCRTVLGRDGCEGVHSASLQNTGWLFA